MQDISHRFADPRPIILDGATSTELERRGVPMDHFGEEIAITGGLGEGASDQAGADNRQRGNACRLGRR